LLRPGQSLSTATTPPQLYTLSLHDALPICDDKPEGERGDCRNAEDGGKGRSRAAEGDLQHGDIGKRRRDRDELEEEEAVMADMGGFRQEERAAAQRQDRKSRRVGEECGTRRAQRAKS